LKEVRWVNSYAFTKEHAVQNREQITTEINSITHPSQNFLTLSKEMEHLRPIVVHLRLGDYLPLGHIYGEINRNFLEEAKELVARTAPGPVWIFTQNRQDLSDWIIDALKPGRIVDSETLSSPLETLALMSRAGGFVCSNSTFSWWAAFIKSNPGRVVVPRYSKKLNVFSSDMVLDDWSVLSAD
jgi:hypothetical protein